MAKQLENFKSGKRKSTTMGDMSAKLKPDEMVALGKYFEAKSVPVEPAKDKDLAAVGQYIYSYGNKFSGVAACASAMAKTRLARPHCLVWPGNMRATLKVSSGALANASVPTTTPSCTPS